jgi:hypothetical protein
MTEVANKKLKHLEYDAAKYRIIFSNLYLSCLALSSFLERSDCSDMDEIWGRKNIGGNGICGNI